MKTDEGNDVKVEAPVSIGERRTRRGTVTHRGRRVTYVAVDPCPSAETKLLELMLGFMQKYEGRSS